MKLDQECVRDVLLTMEEKIPLNDYVSLSMLKSSSSLLAYDTEIVTYVTLKLTEAGYISAQPLYGDNKVLEVMVSSITWDGHQFLENVRDPKIWRETKSVTNKVASSSLSILSAVAEGLIKKQLGL